MPKLNQLNTNNISSPITQNKQKTTPIAYKYVSPFHDRIEKQNVLENSFWTSIKSGFKTIWRFLVSLFTCACFRKSISENPAQNAKPVPSNLRTTSQDITTQKLQQNSKKTAPATKELKTLLPPHYFELMRHHLIQGNPPTNTLEFLIYLEIMQQDKFAENKLLILNKQHILDDWKRCHSDKEGLSGTGLAILFDAYFNDKSQCSALNFLNGTYLGNNHQPRIVYNTIIKINKEASNAEQVKKILQQEQKANPNHRPDKIFIPLLWENNTHWMGHFTLLMIEPNAHPPRVTFIDTYGNESDQYLAHEKAVINAAREAYPRCSFVRNTKPVYATDTSCAHDVIELASFLSQTPNGQDAIIKQQWQQRTKEEDLARRLKHAEKIAQFFSACQSNR